MKFDNFTVKAKEALTSAQNNVRYLEQQQVELEHLVLALLEPADGVALAVLEELGCNVEAIRGQVERELARFPKISGGDVYLGPEVLHVLSVAEREARRLRDQFIGPEHILLGATEEPRSAAASILTRILETTGNRMTSSTGDLGTQRPARNAFPSKPR